jgi:Glycosyl hydrolase family 62
MNKPQQTHKSRWSWIAAFAVLTCAVTVPAQSWSVSGVVKNTSGAVLAGVAVTVKDSAASLKATTDASGAFTITSAKTTGILASSKSSFLAGASDANDRVVDGAGRQLKGSATSIRIRPGTALAMPIASARAAASYPVLQFKLTGYNDTTFLMTSASQSAIAVVMAATPTTCKLPTTFKWKDNGGAIASAVGNGWVAIKDFTNVIYNGQHIVYASTHDASNYGSMGMSTFTNWSDAAKATQTKMNTSVVAPELMYFTPKKQWILSYQWGSAKFNYMTSSDPTKANGWGGGGALLTEDVAKADGAAYGPIDQVPICDATNCFLFYAGDNGHIYRASMPIGSFPGVFSGSKSILQDTKENLFEAVEVYTVKGTGTYLMIVECMGSGGRYFRAFTATSLGGTWSSLAGANNEATPFAGKKNVTFTTAWTNDISHGDLVRTHDETRTIDPCNLQMIYQGYDPNFNGAYDLKPYKMGLLTLTK